MASVRSVIEEKIDSFMVKLSKRLRQSDVDEIKFLFRKTNKIHLENCNALELIEYLEHIGVWKAGPGTEWDFSQMATVLNDIQRADLCEELQQFGKLNSNY